MDLFKKHKNGSIGKWSICEDDEGVIRIDWQVVLGGETQTQYEDVRENNSGRDIDEQVTLRIASRVAKQRDRGYKDTIEEALSSSNQNTLGLLRPMLAKELLKLKDGINFKNGGVTIQPKLNGVRCLVTRTEEGLVYYTRGGKEHVDSSASQFDGAFSLLPIGETVDGELYIHGEKLQTISSIVRKKDHERCGELRLFIYDSISDKDPFDRILDTIRWVENCDGVHKLETYEVLSVEDIMRYHATFVEAGYEGSMIRTRGAYEPGVRSNNLLKLKDFHTAEYVCVGIEMSDASVPVAVLVNPQGLRFRATVPGTDGQKYDCWLHKERYIGRRLTIKYTEMSKDGIPCPTVAEAWRERGE